MAHKKWTISFRCLQRVYHTHTENFDNNMPTVPKTLIRIFFNMSTLRFNYWSQSFPFRNCPSSITSWMMSSQRIFNMNNCKKYLFFIVSISCIWRLHPTKMKALLSNNLGTLCSQTAWWSTFLRHSVYSYCYYDDYDELLHSSPIKIQTVERPSRLTSEYSWTFDLSPKQLATCQRSTQLEHQR